jgi:hypothetical protein
MADAIDDRLRRASDLSADGASVRSLISMSADDISARLRELAEVSALCFELEAAGATSRKRGTPPVPPSRP